MKKKDARKRKKRLLIATLAVAGVIVSGLTYAWLTGRDEVKNTFKTSGNLKTTVVENFTPPTNWQPGTTTDKVVQVTNTGTVDAYTRLELVPTLTYYTDVKSGAIDGTKIDEIETSSFLTGGTYVPASKEAIDAVAENANTANITDTGKWHKFEQGAELDPIEEELKPLKGLTVPANVTLWVKASKGDSTTSNDSITVETGYNYDFMAYYTDNITDSTGTTSTKYYAVNVTDATYSGDTELGNVPHTISNATNIEFTLQPTRKVEYDYKTKAGKEAIDKMVTINVNASDKADGDEKWYERGIYIGGDTNGSITKFYYYKPVLKSGTTTTPLVKSVKFNDSFADTVYDAQFDLNVVNVSTQAIYDAANETFKAEASGVDGKTTDAGFDAEEAELEKASGVAATTTTTTAGQG